MRSYQYSIWIVIATLLLASCAKEESIDVVADFKATVVNEDYSVPVKVEIENTTTGADTYQWTFEGAVTESSTDKNPKTIYYNTPGKYKITLKASNKDGSQSEKSVDLQIDAAVSASFDWQMQGSDISPLTLQMVNKSLGATSYQWEFEGGTPSTSTEENPVVVFTASGEHKIKLTVTNGRETYSADKTVTVNPAMTIDFDWTVDFIDQDYQAPVTLHMENKSTHAFSYEWSFTNAPTVVVSREQHPDITIQQAGNYVLQLKATNDKESKTIQKNITVHPDKNLLSFTNIKLGINTAQGTIGCFFSSELGKVIMKNEVSNENGARIDFAFFGLNASFSYNQFLSPDNVQQTAFLAIPNAGHTSIINSQELVSVQLTPAGFDAIDEGSDFSAVTINETTQGLTPFNNLQNNRVVLFQTSDGRKGAVKIISYIAEGKESYILVHIKVQKKP